ncbi:uncharacterized protein LOC662519 [Tribolium castaneum]|uniref:DUF4485 domain-containing protein n=1 Tax=Tribolium castaneum TaxID=7070 RepID=D6WPG4_TRICA|nr:PREDICTED: uncharacterized protein LOC662519 [Tribolium castaneum]EFA06809.2 hypothetical protein TcasGA2_TC009748 [Tribolium castaneum]|eukprot:XP_008199734.2 PREDICTED: uncharacterized protein LOC662519 [Tribolium castaneum]
MEIENKLDEDFVFYLGFVGTYFKHIRDKDIRHHCEQWLLKLCGEPCQGIEKKRGRNIYLSQLILCMQTGILGNEFKVPVNEVDVANATQVFQLQPEGEAFQTPGWLEDNDADVGTAARNAKTGRTYVATRTLPGGQGAFAYVAVSLDEEEPKWLGGGEGVFDRHMEQKFREEVPDYEMEKILARRKDPKEREKVITFYKVLLTNIEDELDEKIHAGENDTVNGLLEQLEQDMRDRGQFEPFAHLNAKDLRNELLLVLHDRIQLRINKVMKREELLDEIEKGILAKSFFETSVTPEDKFLLPPAMWEQAINKIPNKKLLEKLRDNYPMILIEKFLKLLSDYKEEIAVRMHRRHENIAAQMKRELRREDEKGKKLVEGAQIACDHATEILKAVKEAYTTKAEVERRNAEKVAIPKSEHSELYDQMRAALLDTQKSVEDEAARGKVLAAQIGEINEQTEMCLKVTEENVRKIEEKNMEIMKNIKRLNAAIDNQQKRIEMVQKVGAKKGNQLEFFF